MFKQTVFVTLCVLSQLSLTQAQAQEHQDHSAHNHAAHQMQNMEAPSFGVLTPDFELIDNRGSIKTLKDFQGQHLLVGFGFTHCSYVCPTMTANMAGALRQLPDKYPAAGILISVDTERDSPELTHRYATAFHKKIVGLSGSHEQVSEAAKNFKVNFAVTKTPNDYTVQHTANIFLLDPQGGFIDSFGINATPEEMAASILQ